MSDHEVSFALPTADRRRAYAFVQALGLPTRGEPADDGVPEPLQVVLNERTTVMYIPTGGFGWVTAGRTTAPAGTVECLISLAADSDGAVDDLLARAADAGADIAAPAIAQPWGYLGVFADPDGHLWQVIHS
jgi:uncharacterized protein